VRKPSRNQKIIGETIRRFRKHAGLTQEKLAEKADLHPVYVGELERGEETASVDALVRVARALGIKLRELVNDV
jgi:XRE family transcriptional regulator, regulator of sulfur utilization